ncbi:hypothetical protein DB32_006060 [Sandaracinus amylolyticus]|uniref:DUF4238 domain-containing protein n=1 Tax=Sandaracinus amylolyticus TaxID=927083 RepID=A0A0F6W6U4_9BACT|nr:hypothetical protein DB32_006060 [Sandaracinus amylolyticus]
MHEQGLGNVENVVAPIVRGMIEGERVPARDTEPAGFFATFVSLQLGRTPTAAAVFEEQATQLMRATVRSHPAADDDVKQYLKGVRVTSADAVQWTLTNALHYAGCFLDLKLKLLRNETATDFITSDAPAALHNTWAQHLDEHHGTIGMACSGLQVFLPLSPRHVALLYDDRVYRVGSDRADVVPVRDARLVKQINSLQVTFAERALFYQRESSAKHIDALPWELRPEASARVETCRYVADDGRSHLISTRRVGSRVKLKSEIFAVRAQWLRVPDTDRVRSWRPLAMTFAELVREERQHQERSKPRPRRPEGPDESRRFRRVIED